MNRGGEGFLLLASVLLAVLLQLLTLPEQIAPLRPQWVALTLAYWAYWGSDKPLLVIAWVTGLVLDVLFDSLLGQHALALVTVVFLVARLRPTLSVFSLLQISLALAPVWALYAFLLFWIDGLSHHTADAALRWLPVASSTLIWPLMAGLMDRLLTQHERRGL